MLQEMGLDTLSAAVTGRQTSLFDDAFDEVRSQIADRVHGRNILFTGGGGFIASQLRNVILQFEPKSIVLVDNSENMLAEAVRQLRSTSQFGLRTKVEPRLVDITSPLINRLWADLDPIHECFQFAAAKHVRSEREPVSLLRMLQVNLNGTVRFSESLKNANPEAELFVVSTDKAADPSSLMGASKRLMEMAILGTYPDATTTRFANVAFSTGSLLESWLMRLRAGQPLAVPSDTLRYFVSPLEAGQICAIAAVAPSGSVVVPDEESTGMVDLEAALTSVLAAKGLTPLFVAEEDAISFRPRTSTEVAVVRSARDTAGEKREEKFVAQEEARSDWLPRVGTVAPVQDASAALAVAEWVAAKTDGSIGAVAVADIAAVVSDNLAEFRHVSAANRLDDRI